MIEEWEKMENQESYMNWRVETGLVDVLSGFLDGDLVVKKYLPRVDI